MRYLLHILLLGAAWVLWSGHYTPLILSFGVISVLLVVWIAHRMDVLDPESHPYHLSWRPIVYLPWLVKEIVLSNIHVALMVLQPHKIHPHLVRVATSQRTDLGRVIHANSITITPGTISLDLRDGYILVHALTDTTAEGVMSGDMDARVTQLEGAH